jgi:hypothetical protein
MFTIDGGMEDMDSMDTMDNMISMNNMDSMDNMISMDIEGFVIKQEMNTRKRLQNINQIYLLNYYYKSPPIMDPYKECFF